MLPTISDSCKSLGKFQWHEKTATNDTKEDVAQKNAQKLPKSLSDKVYTPKRDVRRTNGGVYSYGCQDSYD